MTKKLIYEEETYQIIGACFEVYKEKGCGFLEGVYQECLEIEFSERGIPFQAQPPQKLQYKGRELKKSYCPDFLCYDDILVEIKALSKLTGACRAQTINYLKATSRKVALLVNFGHYPGVEHERLIL